MQAMIPIARYTRSKMNTRPPKIGSPGFSVLLSALACLPLLAFAVAGTNAAGFTPGPAHDLLTAVGITHGESVSNAVKDAEQRVAAGAAGEEAISQAACQAAHDRSTLPPDAQAAPGQQGKGLFDCSRPEEHANEFEERARPADLGPDTKGLIGPERARAAREVNCAAAQERAMKAQGTEDAAGLEEAARSACAPATEE